MRKDNYRKRTNAKVLEVLFNIFKTRKPKVAELSKEAMAKQMEKQAKQLEKLKADQKKMQKLARKNKKLAQKKQAQARRKEAYERGKKTGKKAGEFIGKGLANAFKGSKNKRSQVRR